MITRRSILKLFAAPAIVRVANIMPVKAMEWIGEVPWPLSPPGEYSGIIAYVDYETVDGAMVIAWKLPDGRKVTTFTQLSEHAYAEALRQARVVRSSRRLIHPGYYEVHDAPGEGVGQSRREAQPRQADWRGLSVASDPKVRGAEVRGVDGWGQEGRRLVHGGSARGQINPRSWDARQLGGEPVIQSVGKDNGANQEVRPADAGHKPNHYVQAQGASDCGTGVDRGIEKGDKESDDVQD